MASDHEGPVTNRIRYKGKRPATRKERQRARAGSGDRLTGEAQVGRRRDIQRLKQAILDDGVDKLPDDLKHYLQMLHTADNLLMTHRQPDVEAMLAAQYNISQYKAKKIINEAKDPELFNSQGLHDKAFGRKLKLHWVMVGLEGAKQDKDWRAMASLTRELDSIFGLDQPDQEHDPKNLGLRRFLLPIVIIREGKQSEEVIDIDHYEELPPEKQQAIETAIRQNGPDINKVLKSHSSGN